MQDTVASWRWKECMIDAEILRPGLHLEILNPKKGENLICLTSFVNFIRLDKEVQLEGVANLDLHFIQMAVKVFIFLKIILMLNFYSNGKIWR